MVASYLGHLGIGIVHQVCFIPKKVPKGDRWPPQDYTFNHAVVHFETWGTTPEAEEIRLNLIRGKRERLNVIRAAGTTLSCLGKDTVPGGKWVLRLEKRSKMAMKEDPAHLISCQRCCKMVDLNDELSKPTAQQFHFVPKNASSQDYAPGVCGECNQKMTSLTSLSLSTVTDSSSTRNIDITGPPSGWCHDYSDDSDDDPFNMSALRWFAATHPRLHHERCVGEMDGESDNEDHYHPHSGHRLVRGSACECEDCLRSQGRNPDGSFEE